MPCSSSFATRAGASVERMQTSAPRCSASLRRDDDAAQLVDACDQPLVEGVHMLAGLGDPDLHHQLHRRDSGVDVRDRRCPGLEAARGTRRRVVVDVHLEDVLVGEPAGLRRQQAFGEAGPRPHETEPGRAEQVLEDPGGEHVDAERADIERIGADRLVGVEDDERAALVRDARDLLDVEPRAVAVADRGDRDDSSALVDRLLEPLDRDRPRRRQERARPRRRATPARARSGRSSETRSR